MVTAVTGARGRLGRAVVEALRSTGQPVVEWSRPEYDLDDPRAARALARRTEPTLVIHAAAWTDVDGCARDPQTATRRNTTAVEEIAAACLEVGSDLVIISTNEVFDGRRTDGAGYLESDPVAPANPYGSSKARAEEATRTRFEAAACGRLWIVRTSWLFGPPGADFPAKILAAAARLPQGEPLRVVDDEYGRPTYAVDLATAILELIHKAPAGTYHLANEGQASRFDWAQHVLRQCEVERDLQPMSASEYQRASTPPGWGVLDTNAAARHDVYMRPWQDASVEYQGALCAVA
jgi:dTDP-4-dehydrorhamnose reductase